MVAMSTREIAFVSLNAVILALFYTLFGLFISFVLYYLFDEFDEKWKERSIFYQLADVSTEIALLAIISFWSAHVIELAPPFFPVRKLLDTLVDDYISGIFFIFAVFVFMNQFTDKLKFLFEMKVGPHFDKFFAK
jgi:hypothetical protein